jgi:hypothetical protein
MLIKVNKKRVLSDTDFILKYSHLLPICHISDRDINVIHFFVRDLGCSRGGRTKRGRKKADASCDASAWCLYLLLNAKTYSTPLSFGAANAALSAGVIAKFKLIFFGGIALVNHFA